MEPLKKARRNLVWRKCAYARKGDQSFKPENIERSDSSSSSNIQHSTNSDVEEATMEWCYKNVLTDIHGGTASSLNNKCTDNNRMEDSKVVQVHHEIATTDALDHRAERATFFWDRKTLSKLPAQPTSFEISSTNSLVKVSSDEEDVEADNTFPNSLSRSSLQNLNRNTAKSTSSDGLENFCQKKCGVLCLTAQGALQILLLGMEESLTGEPGNGTGDTTPDDLSSLASSGSSADSPNAVDLVDEPNKTKQTNPANRFSVLWKKSLKERRMNSVVKLRNGHNGTKCLAKQNDLDLRLLNDGTEKHGAVGSNNLSQSFRRLMKLRNERQQLKGDQAKRERTQGEKKIAQTDVHSPKKNEVTASQQTQILKLKKKRSTTVDIVSGFERVAHNSLERAAKSTSEKIPQIQYQERKPFDKHSTDFEYDNTPKAMTRHNGMSMSLAKEQKPYDEESGGFDHLVFPDQDTPFMNRSTIYGSGETSTKARQGHPRNSPPISSGATLTDANRKNRSKGRNSHKLTNLERKLGKRSTHQDQDASTSSGVSSEASSYDGISTTAVLAAVHGTHGVKRTSTLEESDTSTSVDTSSQMITRADVAGVKLLGSIQESDPSESSMYSDSEGETNYSSAAAIHKSFQF